MRIKERDMSGRVLLWLRGKRGMKVMRVIIIILTFRRTAIPKTKNTETVLIMQKHRGGIQGAPQ